MQNGGEKQERNTWLYQQLNITVEPIKGWRLIGDLSYRYNTQYSHWDYLTVHQTGVDGKTKGNTGITIPKYMKALMPAIILM